MWHSRYRKRAYVAIGHRYASLQLACGLSVSLQLACGLPRRRPTPSYIRVYIGYVEKRPAKVGQVWLSWYSVRSLVLCPFATHPHCKISSNSCLRHSSTLVSLSSRRGNFHCSIPLEGPTNWRTSVRAHKRRVASYSASTNSLCRRCRGHSKLAEQQHVETVARQGVTPHVTSWLLVNLALY